MPFPIQETSGAAGESCPEGFGQWMRAKLVECYGKTTKTLKWGSQSGLQTVLSTLVDKAEQLFGSEWPLRVGFMDGQSDQRQMMVSAVPESAVIFASLSLA